MLLKEQTNKESLEAVLERIKKLEQYIDSLSDEQKAAIAQDPTGFGKPIYDKSFELLGELQKYVTGDLSPDVMQYLSDKKDALQLQLLLFGSQLKETFGDIYNNQMAPIFAKFQDLGSYFSGADREEGPAEEPVPETDPEAAASAPIPTTQVSPPAPEAATAGAVTGAAAAASEPKAETGSSPSSNEPQKAAQTTEDDVFSKYMVGPYNPSSSMDRDKMAIVKDMMGDYEKKFGKPFDINNPDDLRKMQPIANAAYSSKEYKQAARKGPIPYKPKRPVNKPEPKGSTLYKTREGGILGIGAKDKYSPDMPAVGTKKYQAIDTKTGNVTQVRRAKPVKTINTPKPGALRGKNK